MLLKQWLALGVLVALPLAAAAQQAAPGHSRQAGPLDAGVPVPAPAYVSAFRNYQAAADEQASPDEAWRAANKEVGRLGGHAGHLEEKAGVPSPAARISSPASSPSPSPSSSSPSPSSSPRMAPGAMDHGKHHH